MGKPYAPISFDLIEEGRLASSVNESLQDATKKLLAHVGKYGPAHTAGAKAEVTVKITVQFEGEGADYTVKGALSTKLPGRPSVVTRAIQEVEQTGEETLFVRASGSSDDSPRQGRLATDDGRGIDPATGKAFPPIPGPDTAKKKDADGK